MLALSKPWRLWRCRVSSLILSQLHRSSIVYNVCCRGLVFASVDGAAMTSLFLESLDNPFGNPIHEQVREISDYMLVLFLHIAGKITARYSGTPRGFNHAFKLVSPWLRNLAVELMVMPQSECKGRHSAENRSRGSPLTFLWNSPRCYFIVY